jgi:nitroimidazol reductase NimA-like FMN-containing flavoprotein (pyridoxamine 5'-phosphate oxidase superfamily)
MSEKRPPSSEKALEALKNLLMNQRVGVLSTFDGVRPYANIIAFTVTKDFKEILFASPKATRKIANLEKLPKAALLVDNRSNSADDFHAASAVTAIGDIREVSDSERQLMIRLYLESHPYLEDFVRSPSCAFIKIQVSSYILVRNFQEVTEFHLPL